ncbi:MAG TPA: DNA polymerase III subunit gamma/tau [Phycisphaerales bacterium]|nr:DNA polymerase III subunit gamma/tau [Phycisphaerales bacterium]
MASYLVLARKYRSQTFDQLVGQEATVNTLLTAIKLGRVAHAYLFTGTRGVGKTSSARLFADAINNPDADPAIRKAILSGQDTDVIEIDAASNSGVDEARDLIANSVYAPMRGRKKIYIIDECHMLSTAAFNALLKTMEEPPAHVVFILCTTETHKVPATIQSRCQRFDFRNIAVPQIAQHLAAILKKEGFSAEDELLYQVARLGNGSMRDALSLLDRLIAAGEKKLTLPMLERLLGLPDRDVVVSLVDAVAAADAAQALDVAGALLTKGVSIDQLLTTLAERFRDLMVLAACGPETSLIELSDESRKTAARQAQAFDAAGLVHMITLVESVAGRAKSSSFPRALVDALIVRLAMAEKFADVTALVTGSTAVSARPAVVTTPSRTAAPAKKP